MAALFAAGGGAAAWEDYIKAALYHPDCGYYSARVSGIGSRGDFTTAPGVSPLLGMALARRARQWRASLAPETRRRRLALIEAGAGEGHLTARLLRGLGWAERWRWRVWIVETSPVLRERQKRRLGRAVSGWFENPQDALNAAGGPAFVFANELADAFPPVVAEWRQGRWREIAVGPGPGGPPAEMAREPGGRCAEALRASSLAPLAAAAAGADGAARVEILLSFKEWLAAFGRAAAPGTEFWLIDYGDTAEKLLRSALSGGTLRAYCRQQRLTGIEVARRFGRQDITCDVNFTDVALWGREAGLIPSAPLTLAAFLRAHLPERALARAAGADARLLDESDAGGRFLALRLVKPEAS